MFYTLWKDNKTRKGLVLFVAVCVFLAVMIALTAKKAFAAAAGPGCTKVVHVLLVDNVGKLACLRFGPSTFNGTLTSAGKVQFDMTLFCTHGFSHRSSKTYSKGVYPITPNAKEKALLAKSSSCAVEASIKSLAAGRSTLDISLTAAPGSVG